MRLINSDSESKDRKRRVLLLSKRLDELAAARRELLHQLETIDAQASAAQLEHNTLHNMDAPISTLPDDVLAMMFEEGTHPQESRPKNASCNFGVLVSHVIHRWRTVSIATPRLWTSIWCRSVRPRQPPYPEERVATFLSRARSIPLDIHIDGFRDEDFSSAFLKILGDHLGHCRQLCIYAEDRGLTKALKYISSQSMPLLVWIDLECSSSSIRLHERLFPSDVPCLTTARIGYINSVTMHRNLPAFASLISLQLKCIFDPEYSSFRDALMALPSLRHLDLNVECFDIPSPPTHLPILLPYILHLHLNDGHYDHPHALSNLLSCIQAASLVALSLSTSADRETIALNSPVFVPNFPSLQHLVLNNAARRAADITAFALSFPSIGRLTLAPGMNARLSLRNLDQILGILTKDNAHIGLWWPKLESIALGTGSEQPDVPQLMRAILQLQAAGHPLRTLLLPKKTHAAMVEVGEIIEIDAYYVDWPTPFDS